MRVCLFVVCLDVEKKEKVMQCVLRVNNIYKALARELTSKIKMKTKTQTHKQIRNTNTPSFLSVYLSLAFFLLYTHYRYTADMHLHTSEEWVKRGYN